MDLNTIEAVARPRDRGQLAGWRDGDAWLAGGTWLFSEPQPDLRRLVDLGGLDWPSHAVSAEGLRLAATCTFARLAALDLPLAWIAAPLVRQCCDALLGSFKIQAVATIGGNLCLALPAGPMAALATALDGVCQVWTPDGGERLIAAADFVVGPQRNALAPGEVLRSLDLPARSLARRTAFRRASLTPLGRSAALLVGTVGGGFALTVTAATPQPYRLAFASVPARQALRTTLEAAIPPEHYVDDVHGRPDWRRHMTLMLAEEIRAELSAECSA